MNKAYTPYNGVERANIPTLWEKTGKHFFREIDKKKKLAATLRPIDPYIVPIFSKVDTNASSVIECIDLLGVRVHLLTENRLHNHIAKIIDQGCRELILNVNVHCYSMVRKHPWLKNFLNQANITFCDGAGVMLGAKILGKKRIPQRITYADWMWNFSKFAEKKEYSFFFLGAKPGVAEKAARKLQEKYPGLKIATHHGYFDKTAGSAENQEVIEKINASKANILVLGFGMPIQEKWLKENQDKLDINISLTGGAVFDYLSGELKRGPRWLVDNGMECIARLLIEPKRLWKRYLIGNTVFLYQVIAERLAKIARKAAAGAQEALTEIEVKGNEALAQFIDIIIKVLFPQPKPVVDAVNRQPDYADAINRRVAILTGRRTALRKYRRTKLNGYSAEIEKNGVLYQVTINDASLKGIQLGNIPSVATKRGGHLHVTVSNLLSSTEYQLTVKTEWKKQEEGRRLITAAGFSIISASENWNQLTTQQEAR